MAFPSETIGNERSSLDEFSLCSTDLGHGRYQTEISAPSIHCGGCMRAIENGVAGLPGVDFVRVNLSTKRVKVRWRKPSCDPADILRKLSALGFDGHVVDAGAGEPDNDPVLRNLVRCLAVSGFGAANVMGLSIAVWSGADPQWQETFHQISAAIAIPCALYAGQIFFRSALSALRGHRLNMDVPISLAILSALALSLYETVTQGTAVYFDAAVALPFFLLIGRVLDHLLRERARTVIKGLMRLSPAGATVVQADGTRIFRRIGDIESGMQLIVEPGERLGVDGIVAAGRSDIDISLVTGEDAPKTVDVGSVLRAGTVNLTGPLTVEASATAEDSFLGEIIRTMAHAEDERSPQLRWADRAAEIYAPAVHIVAGLTLVGWLMVSGDWHYAIATAIAVLIITCPCALGLAIPIVQVVAVGRLMKRGILAKCAGALERLADIDTIVFDKTGTLTLGKPRLYNAERIDAADLARAAGLARNARHPLAQSIFQAAVDRGLTLPDIEEANEIPGYGIQTVVNGTRVRLGKRDWSVTSGDFGIRPGTATEVVLSENGIERASFRFENREREDARAAVSCLSAQGYELELLSGDHAAAVRQVADRIGIAKIQSDCLPHEKLSRIQTLERDGHTVLMVGDGLNDSPALQAASVSMTPSTASEISRSAADFVFLRESLMAVPTVIDVAKRARALIVQNLIFAAGYNLIAVPFAALGFVSPLVAAVAMSSSSLLVTLNAIRLSR